MALPQLISPPPSPALHSLPVEINSATRTVHTKLNRLITTRLPLALPPHSSDPRLYAHGIAAFAHIYYAFEESWHTLIQETLQARRKRQATEGRDGAKSMNALDEQLHQYLAALIPAELWRTTRLNRDIHQLEEAFDLDLRPVSHALETTRLHVRRVTRDRPHVLLAYAWVMYMAIFSGGRWIRQQLREAGEEFWDPAGTTGKTTDEQTQELPGFSFFCFVGLEDGEDIKTEFKRRLEDADEVLTPFDRREVIEEAQTIFANCIAIVEDLDARLQTDSTLDLSHQEVVVDGPAVKEKAAEGRLETVQLSNAWLSTIVHPVTALMAVFFGCSLWIILNAIGAFSSHHGSL